MNLELHIIQNFAPSNLNRDDTGSPKSCEFGGYRRARISSQCIKRAVRGEFEAAGLIPEEHRATRSKLMTAAIADRLVAAGRDGEAAPGVAEAGLSLLDVRLAKGDQKTEYLLYLGSAEIDRIAAFCDTQWDALATAAASGTKSKKGSRDENAKKLAGELKMALDGGRAADLALFGRMLADLPERNIDAASQVAHAISTHRVEADFDYYTAVDDLRPKETTGADMIGTVEFNSACYYRYANVDVKQLRENLGDDVELTRATLRAFLVANRDATPSGKQNAFAARNAPSFVFVVIRDRGFWSLANAFVDPVSPRPGKSLVDASIERLDGHWGDLVSMYGVGGIAATAFCAMGSPSTTALKSATCDSFDAVVDRAMDALDTTLAGR